MELDGTMLMDRHRGLACQRPPGDLNTVQTSGMIFATGGAERLRLAALRLI